MLVSEADVSPNRHVCWSRIRQGGLQPSMLVSDGAFRSPMKDVEVSDSNIIFVNSKTDDISVPRTVKRIICLCIEL